jgi:hypothetical protein
MLKIKTRIIQFRAEKEAFNKLNTLHRSEIHNIEFVVFEMTDIKDNMVNDIEQRL